MKRFVNLGTQLWSSDEDMPNQFAWYDTITQSFEIHSGTSVWETWENFKNDYQGDNLERYMNLFPKTQSIEDKDYE